MPIITDAKKIEHLLHRRVAEVLISDSLQKKLVSGKKLRVKLGVDPTAPDLHLGHTIPLFKLREFQELGHQIVLIIGDYTTLIGDPSGKSQTRPMLSSEEITKNAKTYMAQVGKVLDLNKTEVHWNSEWFAKMQFHDILRLAAQFTVARMIERDDFAKRLKAGNDIHVHELLYSMMQAYDSIMVEADIELGGTDQKFNLLAGRDLQRKMGKPEQDLLMVGPILVGLDGVKKMSKSLGNYIGLTDTPDEMFGKVMSIPDSALWNYFVMTTEVSDDEIAELQSACEHGKMNPRDAKMRLAKEIITLYHSSDVADTAEANFIKVFRNKEKPEEIEEVRLRAGEWLLVDLLVETKLADSKTAARRVIEQGGVKIDDKVIGDVGAKIFVDATPKIMQKGKRFFISVRSI